MKKARLIHLLWLCLAASVLSQFAVAQEKPAAPEEDYVKAHYTKYEYRIPMRDGVHLFTSVYVPKDASQSYPFMIDRTPYSVAPYGVDQYKKNLGPSDEFEKAGYIFVYQDVRGRYLSEGKFIEMHPHIDDKKSPQDVDDSSDMYDTLEYLLKHVPNNNGKAGIWGISYPGFYTSASIIDSHPALKAASPQAPMTNLFMGDDAYHGGAFMLDANFGFYTFFKPFDEPSLPKHEVPFSMGTPNAYDFYLQAGPTSNLDKKYLKGSNPLFNDQLYHTTFDDYWKARDLSQHMKNVKCAVLVVGGWYDAEDLSGPYGTFYAINKFNPETTTTLVEGPWVHGGWARSDGDHLGDAQFNSKTAEFFRKNIQFPFFEYYLKGKGAPMPKAYVFETGTNVWRTYPAWPPAQAKPKMLYLHAGGKLSFDPPAEREGSDEYISDPAHPVPFVGLHDRHCAAALHGGRSALRILAHRCPRLSDRTADRRRDHCRPHLSKTKSSNHRHRFRLRREAHRRLPQRLSRSGHKQRSRQASTRCASAAHGRLSATGARRADARKVPQQLGET